MFDFSGLIQQGSAHAWLFVPSAILLGVLHGLEPGHSKTMMAAFIVAVRGTVTQAVLLGLAATLSHTLVVWAVALVGLHFGGQINSEGLEPYFQLGSAVLIIGIAGWMLWQTRRQNQDHHHSHDDAREIQTRQGVVILTVEESEGPPRWKITSPSSLDPVNVRLALTRPEGASESYSFHRGGPDLLSIQEIPEPHSFSVVVGLRDAKGWEEHGLAFSEHLHQHDALDVGSELGDAHERQHAAEIQRRFSNRKVTTGQIVMFGLTGGLIPCPASITVLLICLQLKQFTLGAVLVLCFSIGLAITMVGVGAGAALSLRHVSNRWSGFERLATKAPYFSTALIMLVGLYTGYLGWMALAAA